MWLTQVHRPDAKYALSDSARDEKRCTIRIGSSTEDHVKIELEDNGIGIARENLSRIFRHGFTTRQDGHGFGLHSSALAAKELGGALTVHSNGPGQGATFSLTLPVEPAQQPGLERVDNSMVYPSPEISTANY